MKDVVNGLVEAYVAPGLNTKGKDVLNRLGTCTSVIPNGVSAGVSFAPEEPPQWFAGGDLPRDPSLTGLSGDPKDSFQTAQPETFQRAGHKLGRGSTRGLSPRKGAIKPRETASNPPSGVLRTVPSCAWYSPEAPTARSPRLPTHPDLPEVRFAAQGPRFTNPISVRCT